MNDISASQPPVSYIIVYHHSDILPSFISSAMKQEVIVSDPTFCLLETYNNYIYI